MSTRVARLPGLRFDAGPPASPEVLPRMDVACFAGFAAAGPFHTPVAVDDPAQLAAVFGDDLPLAVDPETGDLAYAQLTPSVRAFLRGGGRRCWVIRVGEDHGLAPPAFPVPGLVLRGAGGGLAPATLPARAPGTWADALRVGAAVETAPAALTSLEQPAPGRLVLGLRFALARDIVPGDLVALHADPWTLLAPGQPLTDRPGHAVLDLGRGVWTRRLAAGDLGGGPVQATFAAPDGAVHVWPAGPAALDDHGRLRIDVAGPVASAPQAGALVRLTGLGPAEAWLVVDELRPSAAGGPSGELGLLGAATLAATAPPAGWTALAATAAEVLTLELWVTGGAGGATARIAGLGFAAEHPRWVGRLPPDADRYAPRPPGPALGPPALWAEAQGFPLCGAGLSETGVLVPLALTILPDRFLGAPTATDGPLRRNGIPAVEDASAVDYAVLAGRTAAAFLDPDLMGLGMRALGASADTIRYQGPAPRALRGLHAAMSLDEVTLLALPDAAQRPCIIHSAPALPPVTAPRTVPHPDPGVFHPCAQRALRPPVLAAEPPDGSGATTLAWTSTDDPDAEYILQGSADPVSFAAAETLYAGPRTSAAVDARRVGPFVRVRAHSAHGDSDWSNGLALDAGGGPRAALGPAADYDDGALLAIQRAAVRACGARGDILAVLSLPGHYRPDDAIAHANELRGGRRQTLLVPPVDTSENLALAHGALYHPWPTVALDGAGPLRRLVPDGAAASVLARRAHEQGVWVAPAAVALRDVVALVPATARQRLLELQEARVNTLRQDPAGFLVLAEETLSVDDDLRPINVRRLLDLLRRLALLYGPEYVFAGNDARLARRAQRGFERVLRRLHGAGAFAGATTAESFEVNVTAARAGETGQLLVELRVAPSLPMRFLTVRLVQGAATGAQLQES